MTRDIHKNVEMLVFYGKDYADQLKIDYKVVYHGEIKVHTVDSELAGVCK